MIDLPAEAVFGGRVGYRLEIYKVPRDLPVVIATYVARADANVIEEWERTPVPCMFKLWRGDRPACDIEAKCHLLRVRRAEQEFYELQIISRPGTDLAEIIHAFESHFGPAETMLAVARSEEFVFAPSWCGLCLTWAT